jgi:PERQ amino acid-rich with GYF domain-containing protein
MQKWYNDGYFSVDLPMKRTHYDTHWTTVGELVKQSNGENVFLRPLISAIPPGLGRANGSPLQTYPQTEHPFNEPYQPAPMRSLRASTLESYLMAGSVPSDSPSSSIGASHSSPDPSMFGTRNKIYGNDVGINGRSTGLGVQEYFTPFTEKGTSHDYPSNLNGTQLPSFGNFGPEGDLNINGFGSNDAYATHDPWKIPLALNVGFPDHKSHPVISSNLGSSTNMKHRQDLADTNNSVTTTTNAFSQATAYVTPDISYQQQSGYIQSDRTPFELFGTSVQDHKDVASSSSIRDHDETLRSATVPGFWGSVSRRPGVRDIELLTSANVGILPNPTSQSSWPRVDDVPISNSQFIGNTLNSSDGLSDTAWKVEPRPSNLTTELIGQQKEEEENAKVDSGPITSLSSTSYNQAPEQFILDAPMRTLSIKTPNKVVSQPSPVNQPVINQSSIINHPTLVDSPPTPKVAWAKEEDIKKKASGISVSLREIQEAEAKKLESRKALEREKERSARVTAESKDIQPFTASWGLPTSQAGSRNNSLPIRETPAMSVSSPTTAVWTSPSLKQPAIKRTMKEIQEEEEKHKKQISKEAIVAANAKRAYADSTAKVSLFHRSF